MGRFRVTRVGKVPFQLVTQTKGVTRYQSLPLDEAVVLEVDQFDNGQVEHFKRKGWLKIETLGDSDSSPPKMTPPKSRLATKGKLDEGSSEEPATS